MILKSERLSRTKVKIQPCGMKMVLIPLFQLNPLGTLFLCKCICVSIWFSKQRSSAEYFFRQNKNKSYTKAAFVERLLNWINTEQALMTLHRPSLAERVIRFQVTLTVLLICLSQIEMTFCTVTLITWSSLSCFKALHKSFSVWQTQNLQLHVHL